MGRDRDLDGVRVSDILQACRHRTHTPEDSPPLERELIAPTGPIVDALDDEIAHSDHNLSVRHLAAMARERSAEVEAVRH